MGTEELHLHNNETNEDYDVVHSDNGVTITCRQWYPQVLMIPREVWREIIAHPRTKSVADSMDHLWNWIAGDDYIVITCESVRSEIWNKSVRRIPTRIWNNILSPE